MMLFLETNARCGSNLVTLFVILHMDTSVANIDFFYS